MLTKSDLKQIGTIVEEKVGPIRRDVASVKEDVASVKEDVKYLRKKVNRIDKTVSIIVKNYDEGDVQLGRRVKTIEDHLGLPKNN